MPSPVGHALGALTLGWVVAPPPADARACRTQAWILAAVGTAPDLDLLIGRHRAETHSLGAAIVVATMAGLLRWPVASSRTRVWFAVLLASLSHPLLDALGVDTAAPFGIMAAWPLSRDYFLTGWDVFLPISRHWFEHGFISQSVRAATREIVILAPLTMAMWWFRRQRPAAGAE